MRKAADAGGPEGNRLGLSTSCFHQLARAARGMVRIHQQNHGDGAEHCDRHEIRNSVVGNALLHGRNDGVWAVGDEEGMAVIGSRNRLGSQHRARTWSVIHHHRLAECCLPAGDEKSRDDV